ncbi:MAG TPA: DUF1302 family protein [Candidatus Binatia bacterium]|nr:DUF1302 family protein [Candidatus Binatia bacterium]
MLLATGVEAVDVPGTGGRVAASGWVDGLAVAPTEDSREQVPEASVVLRLRATPSRPITAHVELRSRFGGPFVGGHPGFDDWVHVFQNHSPDFEANEAWLEAHTSRVDVRAGIQKFAWGKLDGIPPTDILNPRDFHDPIVRDAEERKIGIPALAVSWYPRDWERLALHGLRATFVYVPIAVPSSLPLLEERWFPPSTTETRPVVIPAAALGAALGIPNFPTPLRVPVTFRTTNHRPPLRFDAGGFALRLSGTWRNSDWDFYHYTGPWTGPDVDLRPTVFLDTFDPRDLARTRVHAVASLRQAHDEIHMDGADFSTAVGAATIRGEIAWFDDQPYLRPGADLASPAALARLPLAQLTRTLLEKRRVRANLGDLFASEDAIEWGLGADYLVHGFLPLVQVNQIALVEPAPTLLNANPETRLTGSVRRRFFADRVEVEVRGIYAIERRDWFAFPRVAWFPRDDLRLRLGYLAIGGPPRSVFGQFKQNDEVVMEARYAF